jgi:hypothetical protein
MTEVYQKANIKNQKYKEKSKNVQICNEKVKNSTVSRGASGHGLFYICREYSTNRPFFAKRSQIQRQNTEFRIQKTGEEGKTKPNEPNSKPILQDFGFFRDVYYNLYSDRIHKCIGIKGYFRGKKMILAGKSI